MIEKRKTKRGFSYKARIAWLDGNDIQQTFKRKSDAQTWERTKLQERDHVKITGILIEDRILFSDFAEKWMSVKVHAQLANSSYAAYEIYLRLHVRPHLAHLEMRAISVQHAYQIVQSMQKKGLAPQTINYVIGMLKGLFNEAVRWRNLRENPLKEFKPLTEQKTPFKFWSASEAAEFLKANLGYKHYPLWILALNTGMRRGELAALQWDRVHEERGLIEVSRSLSRFGLVERTKTNNSRYVPINDRASVILEELRREKNGSFVLHQGDGSPLDTNHVYRFFHRAQERAKLSNEIRFHDVRHTFASHFMMNGGNLYDLQKILGHTDSQMTQRYAHLSPHHLGNSIKIVSFGV